VKYDRVGLGRDSINCFSYTFCVDVCLFVEAPMKNVAKCSKKELCTELENRCQTIRLGGIKGFVKHDVNNITYSQGRSDKGLLLRFCPFCGFFFLAEKLMTADEYFNSPGLLGEE